MSSRRNICGIINFDKSPINQAILNDITEFDFTKGVAKSFNQIFSSIGLGSTVNSSLSSVGDDQLYTCTVSSISIVADARIDNRDELISQLYSKGFIQSKIPSDIELICAAYNCWGKNHSEKIIGDFAYLIWDPKKNSLFCVRDPFGSRSLFYYLDGSVFIAASSISQLFASGKLCKEIRDEALAYWLNWQPYDFLTENSFFKNIYRVKPSHILQINADGKSSQRRYWDIDKTKQTVYSNDSEYSEAFFHYYSKAVESVSKSPKPVVVMTSGGMDSTSIVSTLNHLKKNDPSIDFRMLSILYGYDHPADEKKYIQKLASVLSVDSHEIDGTEHMPFSKNEFNFKKLEEPPRYSNSPGWSAAIDEITENRSDVVIIGQNADALFTIQPAIFSSLAISGNYKDILKNIYRYPSGRRHFMAKEMFKQLAKLATPRYLRSMIRRINGNSLINPEFLKLNQDEEYFFKWASPEYGFDDPTKALQYYLLTDYSYPVRDSYNRVPSQYGLEVRDPFLNRDLVEFVLSLPPSQILNKGATKFILRNAMQGYMPDLIRQRRSITTFDWLIRQGLTNWLSDNFRPGDTKSWEIVNRGYILSEPLEAKLAEFHSQELNRLKGKLDLNSGQNTLALSRLILLETWLRSLNKL